MDFSQLIQTIISGVNLVLTRTMNERLSKFHASFIDTFGPQKHTDWIDKTSAGHAMNRMRIDNARSAVASATTNRDQQRSATQALANEIFQENLSPTGKDLVALGLAAEEAAKKLAESSDRLDAATQQYDRIRARLSGGSYSSQVERLESSKERVSLHRDAMQGGLTAKRQALGDAYNSGAAQDVIDKLTDESRAYQDALTQAKTSLDALTEQQDELREQMDRHLSVREKMSEADKDMMDRSVAGVNRHLERQDLIQRKYTTALTALMAEMENPTGMTTRQINKLAASIQKYELEMVTAREALRKSTIAHKELAESIDSRSAGEQATGARERAATSQTKRSEARKYPFLSRIGAAFRRSVGPQWRAFSRQLRNPKLARDRLNRANQRLTTARKNQETARVGYRSSLSSYRQALGNWKRSPSAATKTAAANARSDVSQSKRRLDTANQNVRKETVNVGASAALARFSDAADRTKAVVEAATLNFSRLIDIIAKAITTMVFFSTVVRAAGEAEVRRIDRERTRFSGAVAGSVARYNIQSTMLEAKSTQATEATSVAVSEAMQALRESMQNRNERWENIYNTAVATIVDIATFANKMWDRLDIFTSTAEQFMHYVRMRLMVFGITFTSIDRNTRKDSEWNTSIYAFKQFQRTNQQQRDKKAFPPPQKPIK